MEPLAAHVPSPDARAPGASSRREAVFRDPPPRDDEARALRVAIAQCLVRAPTLPVELPRFQLTLCDVQVDRHAIELMVGHDAPVAALRIERAREPRELVALRTPNTPQRAVTVTVREVHAVAARYTRQLTVMAERVQAAVTDDAWARASALAKTLREIPTGVPMGFYRQLVAGLDHAEGLIRTGFLCNQDCGICWQDRAWGRHSPDQVLRWIEDLRDAGATALILSGGEPTLDPRLTDYIRHARALGFTQVTLETNAIQCAKPGLAERLRDAGVTTAFVSLHSADAETSDAITRAPGTHARTVKGAHALLTAGLPVKFNAVMTQEGIAHLDALPDFLHREFSAYGDRVLGLMLSYPTEPYDASLAPSIVPEPVTLRRVLRATLDRAFALGLNPHGLDGPCGPPLCAFGADPRVTSLQPVPEPVDFRRHLPRCEGCAVRAACFGVRIADVAVYGDACAEPLAARPAGP